MMSIHEEAVRLRAEIARLTAELRAVRSNAEAEIEVLRDRLEEARNERDAALREPRSFTLKVLRLEVRDAWRQLRSDHAHDREDEGTLAEEIATLQRVWHAAEDDLSDARAKLNTARKERDDALAQVKRWEDKEAKRGSCCADMEARAMELEARATSALDRLTRRPVHYLSWRALARVAEDTIAILGGRKVDQAECDACDHPWFKHDAEDGCQADCYCPRAPPMEKKP